MDGRLDNRPAPPSGANGVEEALDDGAFLLARYRRLGLAFLDDVEGSFVVVLHDPTSGLTLLARDGMGNRRASVVVTSSRVAVGDDAALAELCGCRELEPRRLATFFAGEDLGDGETFFRGVRALLPGELLIVERRQVRQRRLPRPDLARRSPPASAEEHVERFAEALRGAVARRLRGRRSAAVLLSGGLDSAPIALHAARQLGGAAVTALSWRIGGAAADEAAFVEATARAGGSRLEWIAGEDALPFRDLARWPVNPSTPEDTAYRWLHERSYRRARELGHDLVLWGFGGDSLYAPARRWLWTLLAAEGPGAAIDRLRGSAAAIGWPLTLRRQLVAPLLPKRRELHRSLPDWLTPASRDLVAGSRPWPPDVARARRPRQALRLLALLDAEGNHHERWHARRHGLELGLPLRDAALVQLCLELPDHLLQRGEETRVVLRRATAGLLPEEVRMRRGKANLRAVVDRGLEVERLRRARPLLLADDALWRGYVAPAAVTRWLDGDLRDDGERAALLCCLHGEVWRRRRRGEDLGSLVELDQRS